MTDKDVEIVGFLKKWGYGIVEDMMLFGGLKRNAIVWRLKRLVESGVVKRERCVFGKYIYYCEGFKGLNVAGYEHDLMCKKMCKYLISNLDCGYLTERELRSEAVADFDIAGLSKKVPDFVLVKDGSRIAIEVELTQKSLKRQRNNIETYSKQLNAGGYSCIYYYCASDEIRDRVRGIALLFGRQDSIIADNIPEGL